VAELKRAVAEPRAEIASVEGLKGRPGIKPEERQAGNRPKPAGHRSKPPNRRAKDLRRFVYAVADAP
jgi:hypothetical protein